MKAFFEYFLVQARAVEADGERFFDVAFEHFVGWSSPYSVGIESLVQYKAQEDGGVVEVEFVPFDVKFSQAGIAVDCVDGGVVVAEFKAEVVEMGVVWRPGLRVFDAQGHGSAARGGHGGDRDFFFAVEEDGAKAVSAMRVFECGGEYKAAAVEVGYDAYRFDARFGYGFEPDGLPYSRDARVVAAAGIEVGALFARWLVARARVVIGADDEVVRARRERVCDVKCEG